MKDAAEAILIKQCYIASATEEFLVNDIGVEIQPDAYALARYLGHRFGCTHILNIGCGHGLKLAKLNPEFKVVGVDCGANIDYCRSHYAFGQWIACTLEQPQLNLLGPEILKRTLVICSNLISHLVDPVGILQTLKKCLDYAPVAIWSSQRCELVRRADDIESPATPAPVHEWSPVELSRLFESLSFDVAFMGFSCNNNCTREKKAILSILHGNGAPRRDAPVSPDFRVIAFLTAYNEEDIIFQSVTRLLRQGVEVYLIDNWSTDGTVAAVEPLLGKGLIAIERFPTAGSSNSFDLHELMKRVEQLAQSTRADWFIHHDVDEIRESPWSELTLREALFYVDQMGFNAVDHTVINFSPIDNGFVSGGDFGKFFSYWEFGRRPGHFQQVKAWKNMGQAVTLADRGGHEVDFLERKVFPYKFLLRHYPVRSQSHGDKKVLSDRKPRFKKERAQRGWHTQYDHMESGYCFLIAPELLTHFESDAFYKDYLVERISGIGIVREEKHEQHETVKSGLWSWLKSRMGCFLHQ